jgi:hypothetical protein
MWGHLFVAVVGSVVDPVSSSRCVLVGVANRRRNAIYEKSMNEFEFLAIGSREWPRD